jgi:predicted GNAT family acetyltransferase
MADVRHNQERSRYELFEGGRLIGIAEYRVAGDRVVFPHTEIVASERGKGHGAELVQAALDDVRTTGRRVVPQCWYVAEFIGEHAEYADLVATR